MKEFPVKNSNVADFISTLMYIKKHLSPQPTVFWKKKSFSVLTYKNNTKRKASFTTISCFEIFLKRPLCKFYETFKIWSSSFWSQNFLHVAFITITHPTPFKTIWRKFYRGISWFSVICYHILLILRFFEKIKKWLHETFLKLSENA